jgi:hypothetical protein
MERILTDLACKQESLLQANPEHGSKVGQHIA